MVLKIHLRLSPDLGLRSWKAEASPLKAGKNGGTYRLTGFSPVLPIAPGDVIRAERGGDGLLWMTELVETCPSSMSMLTPPPHSHDKTWDRWSQELAREGASTYISYPTILSAWPRGRSEQEILEILRRVAPEAVVAVAMESHERHEVILDSVMIDRVWLEWVAEIE